MKIDKVIAKERIERLISLAYEKWSIDKELSRRYVEIARKIGMRCNVRFPKKVKLYICKQCNGLLIPGLSCMVRIRSNGGPTIILTCLECGSIKRHPVSRKRKK